MTRNPPSEVRRTLRQEVGFGCPVSGCNSPYLYYHHFDPPWEKENHHNAAGMIALCAEHHKKADAGAYTVEQLSQMKCAAHTSPVNGRFDWMRNRLLAVVGGNYYFETLTIFEFRGEKAIWFNRSEDGNLLLNVRMLTKSKEPRLRIEDNDWITLGTPADFESPPAGKLIVAKYNNGDAIRVEFFELFSIDDALRKYRNFPKQMNQFPITTVEIHCKTGDGVYDFGPLHTNLPGMTLKGTFFAQCGAAICYK